jgi:hypothetical protein
LHSWIVFVVFVVVVIEHTKKLGGDDEEEAPRRQMFSSFLFLHPLFLFVGCLKISVRRGVGHDTPSDAVCAAA